MRAKTPEGQMGLYKRFEDVPTRHQLEWFSDEFVGVDVWEQFNESPDMGRFLHGSSAELLRARETAISEWRDQVESTGRHPALARPSDVVGFVESSLEHRGKKVTYNPYFNTLENWYQWMVIRVDFPHTYNPFRMAAVEDETVREIWMQRHRPWENNEEEQ